MHLYSFSKGTLSLLGFFLVVGLAGLFFRTYSVLAHSSEAMTFQYVATHPGAAAMGRNCDIGGWADNLHGAIEYKGKIYWGYGNWHKNCGKVDIYAFDPNPGVAHPFTKEVTTKTETIYNFRILPNGKLYAPYVDPANRFINKDYGRKDSNGWTQVQVGLYHVFDVVNFNNSLFLVGSKYGNNTGSHGKAVVYKSARKAESSFKEVLVESHPDQTPRYFFTVIYGGKLYVQSQGSSVSKYYDGNSSDTWKNGPNLLPQGGFGSNSNPFANQVVYLSEERTSFPGHLYAFNGHTTRSIQSEVITYTIYGNDLYIIKSGGVILKTRDLQTWQTVGQFSQATATSMVVAQNRLFIGTSDSRIFRSNSFDY